MDLGIEFPDDLRPEPAEGGSLDEALRVRAPSLLWSAPGKSLDTAKELSIKFDAKEDAEMLLPERPRSLPLMNFLVEPLSEMCLLRRMLVQQSLRCDPNSRRPRCDPFQCIVPPEWRQRSPRTTHSQRNPRHPFTKCHVDIPENLFANIVLSVDTAVAPELASS